MKYIKQNKRSIGCILLKYDNKKIKNKRGK